MFPLLSLKAFTEVTKVRGAKVVRAVSLVAGRMRDMMSIGSEVGRGRIPLYMSMCVRLAEFTIVDQYCIDVDVEVDVDTIVI
jgi:hypothetical protein